MIAACRRYPYRVAILLCLLVYLWHCVAVNFVVDDAFITFRYVRNFVTGQGLVYNPGERVEGYTNFLWTMLLSLFAWLAPHGEILPFAQILGVASGAAGILLAFRFGRLIRGAWDPFCLIAPVLLGASCAYVAWSTAGLETTFYALLISAASYLYLSRSQADEPSLLPPALFALATMTRADGLLFFAVVSCHLLIAELGSGRSRTMRTMLRWLLPFAAVYLPYYAWRFSYYGYPLPNVFYAKVGAGLSQYARGARYAAEFLGPYGGLLLALPAPFLWKRRRERWLQVVLPQVVLYAMYVVYVGGDGLAYERFMVPILPFLCLLAQEGIRGACELARGSGRPALAKAGPAAAGAFVALAALLAARPSIGPILFPQAHRWSAVEDSLFFPGDGKAHPYLHYDNYFIERQRLAARWLESHAPAGSLVASTPAGSIAYYTRLHVIDMLGLNDSHIAHYGSRGPGWNRAGHEKGDGAYVLSRSPDFILLGNVAVLPSAISETDMPRHLVRTSEHQIWASPAFHRDYERVAVELNGGGVFRYFTFYKKKSVAIGGPVELRSAGARRSVQ